MPAAGKHRLSFLTCLSISRLAWFQTTLLLTSVRADLTRFLGEFPYPAIRYLVPSGCVLPLGYLKLNLV